MENRTVRHIYFWRKSPEIWAEFLWESSVPMEEDQPCLDDILISCCAAYSLGVKCAGSVYTEAKLVFLLTLSLGPGMTPAPGRCFMNK